MTDPRLAQLAAALHRATCGKGNKHWTDRRDEPSDTERRTAAAILAALDATPAMLWDDLSYQAGLEDGRHEGRLENAAEIARLRKIEEAARAALVELDIIRAHHPGGGRNIVHIDTHAALRAALMLTRSDG